MDVINTLSLKANSDNRHRIFFVQNGVLCSMTLTELDRLATALAWKLHSDGIRQGSRIGVIGSNGLEWVLLDLAIIKLGGITAGLDVGRFDPVVTIERYGLKRVFVESGEDHGDIVTFDTVRRWISEAQTLKVDGPPPHSAYRLEDASAIKFTSGSTGPPKGMEATVAGINDTLTAVQEMFHHGDDDNVLVFLRLAQLQQRYWIYSALAFGYDITITNLADVLEIAAEVHPSVIMGVPGFFDDVKRRLEALYGAALAEPSARCSAIQRIFGERIRYLWTGSAPADRAMLEFYNDCGVPLYQGYGLNETCIISKNYPGANRVGSVGKVLPHKWVRFDSNGMIITGSRNPIIHRYTWCKPGDNERTFLPSGEVKTQDLGYLDEDGYLYIIGRMDDIIVLSSGRNVLVPAIEERLRQHPAIHACVLYGNGTPFITALISPMTIPPDTAAIERHVAELNSTLFPEQKIKAYVIADEQFSIENSLLTSQFKPIRTAIYERMRDAIEGVYKRTSTTDPQAIWRGAYGQ